ncbi:MAG: tartrate-resistant acid phosphatase type 5 family protein [Acidobacteriota bacterium]
MLRRLAGAALLTAAALACGPSPAPLARTTPTAAAALPQPPAGSLEFLVLGDWGRGGNGVQRQVAGAMAAWARAHPVRFVVSTGDNFYQDGISSVTDRAWKTSFEDVYSAASLLAVPWIVALGNHDYRGNVDAQIEYSKSSSRWRMPARSFTVQETAGDGTRVQFFVMDTTPFLAAYRSFPSRTKVAGQNAAAQLEWLASGLAASTADWKIVVGHHPIHSCGPHGDSAELVRDVLPILARFHVAVYLNGHEHGLEHLESGGIHFLTSGGGSEATRVSPDARTVWAEATGGFLALAASRETLQLRAVNGLGAVRHEAAIPRPAPAP